MRQAENNPGIPSQDQLNMVLCQLHPNGVTSIPLLDAFKKIPRDFFVPPHQQEIAYHDTTLFLSKTRYLLSPILLGKLFQLADIQPTDKVLVVGFTTGYSIAIAQCLTHRVYGLENKTVWVEQAQERLTLLSLPEIKLCVSSLCDTHPTEQDFDVILIEGAVPFIAHQLVQSLAPNGRLVTILEEPQGAEQGVGRGIVLRKEDSMFSQLSKFEAQAPLLPDYEQPKEFIF